MQMQLKESESQSPTFRSFYARAGFRYIGRLCIRICRAAPASPGQALNLKSDNVNSGNIHGRFALKSY
jgi:hypothetical protein